MLTIEFMDDDLTEAVCNCLQAIGLRVNSTEIRAIKAETGDWDDLTALRVQVHTSGPIAPHFPRATRTEGEGIQVLAWTSPEFGTLRAEYKPANPIGDDAPHASLGLTLVDQTYTFRHNGALAEALWKVLEGAA